MPNPINLPRLEALLAARNDSEQAYNLYLVTMLRAAPDLLAELEALRARVREAESWAQRDDSLASYAFQQYGDDARLYNGVHALEAENGKLRARVAELEKGGE